MPSRFRWKLNALRLLWISSPLIALLSYGWKIETQWFEITRSELQFPVKQAIKLAHLSDVHVFEIGEREFKTFEILHRERPDLIVITGDLISSGRSRGTEPVNRIDRYHPFALIGTG
jgi:predicted MPP superfamily phosphohydrolase